MTYKQAVGQGKLPLLIWKWELLKAVLWIPSSACRERERVHTYQCFEVIEVVQVLPYLLCSEGDAM